MNQFEKAIQDQVVCDICGGEMIPLYGGGWDNDRIICGNRECESEIIYPTSTEVEDNKERNLPHYEERIVDGFLRARSHPNERWKITGPLPHAVATYELLKLSEEQRLDAFRLFCTECGGVQGEHRCQCWNDE